MARNKKNIALLIAGLLVIGYTVFLVYLTYNGQNKLAHSKKNEQKLKLQNYASTLKYLFDTSKSEISNLSEHKSIETYFSNRALGMSMKYGLKSSIIKINNKFKDFYEKRKINKAPIYSNIVLLDSKLNIVAKLNSRVFPPVNHKKNSAKVYIQSYQTKDTLELFVVKPLYHKEINIGFLISQLNMRGILKELSVQNIEKLYLENSGTVFSLTNLNKSQKQSFKEYEKVQIEENTLHLLYDMSDKEQELFTSRKFVNALIILTIFLFFGIMYLVRISNKNIKLRTQINLTKDLNKELESKVEEKTKELQELNTYLQERVEYEVKKNKENERILHHQSKMATMGEMIGNIAHQWRQPLSTISTLASGTKIQKEFGILTEKQIEENMNNIVDSVNYLSQTIDDFRDFFKTNKEMEKFYIKNAYEKTNKLLNARFKNKNIRIVPNIQDIEILGFKNEIIQVFLNIFNNSLDALEEIKEEYPKLILVDIWRENEIILINIKDNAKGIPKNIIGKIFESNFTTKDGSKGTGIGLYMTKEIIRDHLKGDIKVSNEKFKFEDREYMGASFEIYLPINN